MRVTQGVSIIRHFVGVCGRVCVPGWKFCARNSLRHLSRRFANQPAGPASRTLHRHLPLRRLPQTPQSRVRPRSSSSKHGHSHANDFLVHRHGLHRQGLRSARSARLRVRRSSEKKFRWETYTNSRGEFALRVPQGGEYEIVVIAKGFADQTNPVSAKSGISEDNVVYRMQPASGGKK